MLMMLGGKCTDKRVDEKEERSMMFVIVSGLTNFCNQKHIYNADFNDHRSGWHEAIHGPELSPEDSRAL
jgi:hypothetical protein